MNSIKDKFSYNLLKMFSYSKNLLTDEQISEIDKRGEVYNSTSDDKFLEVINRYIDYRGKSVIEIGCGDGNLAIKLAKTGARQVVGIDINRDTISSARKRVISEKLEDIVAFECADFTNEYKITDKFDIAFNKAAFEHILSPDACLKKIYASLSESGILGTLFGPLWLSPYGAHMAEFVKIPWVHLIFPEKVVLKVRRECYRPDEIVERYEDIKGHLNRITVKKFRQYVIEAGFRIDTFRLNPGLDSWNRGIYKVANSLINSLPFLQELSSLQLLAILKKISTKRGLDN